MRSVLLFRVLAYEDPAIAIALSSLTGLLFGLASALQATRVEVVPALKEVRANDRSRRVTLSHVLVVGQIALSLLLVLGAGLFVRTLSKLESVQLGFNRENVLLFKLDAAQAGHKMPEIFSFYRDLQTRFGSIPGVRGASVAQSPLVGEGSWFTAVMPVGKQPVPDQVTRVLTVDIVVILLRLPRRWVPTFLHRRQRELASTCSCSPPARRKSLKPDL